MCKSYKVNLKNVVWGSINKKTFLIKISIPSKRTNIFELNDIGLEIWKMLVKKYDSQKILKNLIKKYPSLKKRIRNDFAKFIYQLKENKIVDEIHKNN